MKPRSVSSQKRGERNCCKPPSHLTNIARIGNATSERVTIAWVTA